ncbi:bifunctional metallophosphatase/5'-nucleotidase [Brevibacillus dissolubilis]|uniref:bifunctional metallophosphatase/5'-nucleotidase n=1 Tax=Brevibacillus dissolubilis TaxID=1844116 RepID=UPI0011162ABD|nr:bifunctional UDP-sugar hydrolase/5'-nucleotidase [Brevibacillus dissolubilis]
MGKICTLHLLHTNDIHSQFEKMPKIATVLHTYREQYVAQGDSVLTLDIGDHADRARMKTEASFGQVNVAVLNQSGYQYVTIGNNEGVTLPKQKLDHLYDEAQFKVIVGNIRDNSNGQIPNWAVPYAIHEEAGLTIALLGVTAAFTDFYHMLGWDVQDGIDLVREQVKKLRPRVDAIIVLSHLGLHADIEMATQIEGIDVILGGHTHQVLEQGQLVHDTLIAQAGNLGNFVGHVTFMFDLDQKVVIDKSAEVFATEKFSDDAAITALIAAAKAEAVEVLSEPVAQLDQPFAVDWDRETPFGTFLAASLRAWTGAEIGLATGGLLLTPLAAGKVTRHDLLACLPHPIKPCAVTLTGAELLAVLECALQPEMIQRKTRGYGFRGQVLGWMGVDGIEVYYQTSEADGQTKWQISRVEAGGQPLDLLREYRVATIDMFMFNPIFPQIREGKEAQFFLPEVLREVVAKTLSDPQLIADSHIPRYHGQPS